MDFMQGKNQLYKPLLKLSHLRNQLLIFRFNCFTLGLKTQGQDAR